MGSSEDELRDAMRTSANINTPGIDAEAVVRRVRARRVPKQVAFSSLSVLAIAGVATLGIVTLPSMQPAQDGASTAGMMASNPESSQSDTANEAPKFVDARLFAGNLCGMPTVTEYPTNTDSHDTAPNGTGLILSMTFPVSAPADTHEVGGAVTLTNSGTASVSGTTGPLPIITLSRDGVTVWHTNGPSIMQVTPIELDPGQSHTYDAVFTPVGCGPQDEPDQFRENLPALAAGTYEISAQLGFISDSGTPDENILISGPPSSIELR